MDTLRIASGCFAALFVFAAAVQVNDPDPGLWIAGYLVAATLSGLAAWGRVLPRAHTIASVGFGLWFLSLAGSLPGAPSEAFTSIQMKASAHEEPREAVGLALVAAWSAVLAHRAWRDRAGNRGAVPARRGECLCSRSVRAGFAG